MKIAGMEVIVSEHLPKLEEAQLSHNRSFLKRLLHGKLHDLEFTEHDTILIMDKPSLLFFMDKEPPSREKVLLMSRMTLVKIEEALK